MNAPSSFSFDWILESGSRRKAQLIDFYKEGQWEVAFVEVRINDGDEWVMRYEVGNPLLGGIKHYSAYNTAEKYFFELIGRIHRDAMCRQKEVKE